MSSSQSKNQHLMWRAGFGPAASQVEQLKTLSPHTVFSALKNASLKIPGMIDASDDYLKGLMKGIGEEGKRQQLEKGDQKMVRQKNRESIRNLNLLWLDQMVDSEAQLREKMAFFWHGHFASRNLNVFFQQQMLDVIRKNALGKFGDLLSEVSKSAAMLNFLNANQNRKNSPNENFAREVMELFTLGRGHYTEQDIREAARAFTGWGANVRGEFVFRNFQHDAGTKTIFGRTGNFDGDDILDLILMQKRTAEFITEKIYRFFVNEEINKDHIEWLAGRFYLSGYDIMKLMEDIFTAGWFYDEKNIGKRIKSPIELIAGIRRMLPMEMENEEYVLLVQRLLGQVLFYPPNVAGWPGGRSWIDSTTLMMRLRLPQLLIDSDELNLRPKSDDDQMMGMNAPGRPGGYARGLRADIHWEKYIEPFLKLPRKELMNGLCAVLLQVKPSFKEELINRFSALGSREDYIRTATIQIMSTPEYQLC